MLYQGVCPPAAMRSIPRRPPRLLVVPKSFSKSNIFHQCAEVYNESVRNSFLRINRIIYLFCCRSYLMVSFAAGIIFSPYLYKIYTESLWVTSSFSLIFVLLFSRVSCRMRRVGICDGSRNMIRDTLTQKLSAKNKYKSKVRLNAESPENDLWQNNSFEVNVAYPR